jgi:hypothetical protein
MMLAEGACKRRRGHGVPEHHLHSYDGLFGPRWVSRSHLMFFDIGGLALSLLVGASRAPICYLLSTSQGILSLAAS